jgi:hypothetical protein
MLVRIRAEVEKIVHRMSKILFATEIVFRGLDRYVPEQKLNLLQFTPTIMAELLHRFSLDHAARCALGRLSRSRF